jgi:hypothetical protein
MDETAWVQLEMVKQLIMLFESFKNSKMMQLEVVARRPDGICDVLVYHRKIPLMPNALQDISIFAHQGIVSAIYRTFPEPHYFVTGFLEAIHNTLEAYYSAQVHRKLGEAVRRHAILASRSPRTYPSYFDDVRNRRFEVLRPVLPVPPVSRPPMNTFQPIHRPPVTIRFTQTKNIEALQQTLDEVKKILLIQQRRATTSTAIPIPVRAPAPSTQGPPPQASTPPSRLQQHFSSTPEPAAYTVPNPFCTGATSFIPH